MNVLYFEVDFFKGDTDGIINWHSVKWIYYDGYINSRGFFGVASLESDDKKDTYVTEATWLDPLKYDGSIKNANIILRKEKLLKLNYAQE